MSLPLNNQRLSREAVWKMLQYIPAHNRDTWVKVGMALKSEFRDDGFPLFDEWSQSADNYSTKSAIAVWRSFK